jgi:hypothetical protein
MSRTHLYEDSLRSMEPMWELLGVVRALLAQGVDRDELREEPTGFMLDLREAGREQEEELTYEVLQFLVGWCSPFMKR